MQLHCGCRAGMCYLLSTSEGSRRLYIITLASRAALALPTGDLAVAFATDEAVAALPKGLLLCTGVGAAWLSVCAGAGWCSSRLSHAGGSRHWLGGCRWRSCCWRIGRSSGWCRASCAGAPATGLLAEALRHTRCSPGDGVALP